MVPITIAADVVKGLPCIKVTIAHVAVLLVIAVALVVELAAALTATLPAALAEVPPTAAFSLVL